MATVCAILLAQGGHRVTLWGAFEESIDRLIQNREQSKLLPGARIPSSVRLTANDADCFAGATMVLSAIPTQYMRGVWRRLARYVPAEAPIVSVAKGIENGTLLRPTQIISQVLEEGGKVGRSEGAKELSDEATEGLNGEGGKGRRDEATEGLRAEGGQQRTQEGTEPRRAEGGDGHNDEQAKRQRDGENKEAGDDNGGNALVALSGPNIAAELAKCLPGTAVAAAGSERVARRAQGVFSTQWFRVYTNNDLVGVELAGATKNVIAIAAGILDGLAAGNNAKAALVTRGLVEITRLGVAMGAQPATFQGLAGLGDLITTCVSPEGRNRTVGERIGKGQKLPDILATMDSVAEGVPTTRSVMQLAQRHGVEMPITQAVHAVLFEDKDVLHALSELMNRDPKPEGHNERVLSI